MTNARSRAEFIREQLTQLVPNTLAVLTDYEPSKHEQYEDRFAVVLVPSMPFDYDYDEGGTIVMSKGTATAYYLIGVRVDKEDDQNDGFAVGNEILDSLHYVLLNASFEPFSNAIGKPFMMYNARITNVLLPSQAVQAKNLQRFLVTVQIDFTDGVIQ